MKVYIVVSWNRTFDQIRFIEAVCATQEIADQVLEEKRKHPTEKYWGHTVEDYTVKDC